MWLKSARKQHGGSLSLATQRDVLDEFWSTVDEEIADGGLPPMSRKPFAWSYTALTSFENCPRQHWHTRVAKDVPDPPGEAALWGQRVHKALENRLAQGTPLPPSLAPYEPYAQRIAAAPGQLYVEQQMCFNRKMKRTGWFAKDAWCRVVLDVLIHKHDKAAVADWKTGKRKPENEQLDLFAGATFLAYPSVQVVNTSFIWLKAGRTDNAVYERSQARDIWATFLPRVLRMEKAYAAGYDAHPPKPSGLCRGWCPVRTCEFWTPKT